MKEFDIDFIKLMLCIIAANLFDLAWAKGTMLLVAFVFGVSMVWNFIIDRKP